MRRMRSIMSGITSTPAGFAALQALTINTPLVLATTNAPAPQAGQIHNNAVPVTITGGTATNLTAVNFTVVGTDRRGNPQTEIIAGPNGAVTVTGHLLFNTVSSITPNATNAATVSAGWAGTNYGPWIVTAYHQAAVILRVITAVTADVYATTYDLLDPTVFLPQGQGGVPTSDVNFAGGLNSQNTGQGSGPYPSAQPYPLVPAALQAACPQLLSTVNCLPEDDNTYSEGIVAPTTFTAATAGAGGNTATEVRLDPTGAFAWRLVVSSTGGLAQMDVNVIRPALS